MQFGGRDNAAAIFKVVDEIISEERWSGYFEGFKFPYGFFGPDEYMIWLDRAGLNASRVELVQKDMAQNGRDGLASWFKSTWLPYIEKVPEDLRENFIYEVVDRYVLEHPLDSDGAVYVGMVRLEVEAEKNRA